MNPIRAILALCLLLSACGKDPVSRSGTDNAEVQVDLLFTHDGCKVYRFSDVGYYRYYAVCGNAQVSTSYSNQQSCGKYACPKPDEITTAAP